MQNSRMNKKASKDTNTAVKLVHLACLYRKTKAEQSNAKMWLQTVLRQAAFLYRVTQVWVLAPVPFPFLLSSLFLCYFLHFTNMLSNKGKKWQNIHYHHITALNAPESIQHYEQTIASNDGLCWFNQKVFFFACPANIFTSSVTKKLLFNKN